MMYFEPIDNRKDPHTEAFEKLEFLPERPAPGVPQAESGALSFLPEHAPPAEPPVSFDPAAEPDAADNTALDFTPFTGGELDLDADTPFELFGTSLFADLEPDPDEPDDDLDF